MRKQSNLVLSLKERGLWLDSTKNAETLLFTDQPCTVYCGFDPSSDSLHIGNLLPLIVLSHFIQHNHHAIVLIGGATINLGDPTGQLVPRTSLLSNQIYRNITKLSKQTKDILRNGMEFKKELTETINEIKIETKDLPETSNDELKNVTVVNNSDWYSQWDPTTFIGKIGFHFRLATMLSKDCIKSRMISKEGANFSEFSYQIFQSYDFLHLFNSYNCNYQIGGSDQFGNITGGIELVRKVTGQSVHGITLPLLLTSNGEKIGKSKENGIWLEESKTSSFHIYQHFLNTSDADVERYLKLFTFLSLQQIQTILDEHNKTPEKRLAQTILASKVTLLIHGKKGLEKAEITTRVFFGETSVTTEPDQLLKVIKNIPSIKIQKEQLETLTLVDVFRMFGLSESIVRVEKTFLSVV